MNSKPNLDIPLIVIGGGGHAKVLISALLLQRRNIIGFVDLKRSPIWLTNITHLGDDSMVFARETDEVRLVNGVGSVDSTKQRQSVYEKFAQKGYLFETIIHPSAIVAPEVDIDYGVQVMAGAVIQPGSLLGIDVIVNTGARIDHDCLIDAHAHIAPGVTLSGGVHIGEGAHIGTGASIVQGITVGAGSTVGAGAVVIRNVPPRERVVGVPAKIVSHLVPTRSQEIS